MRIGIGSIIITQIVVLIAVNAYAMDYQISEYTYSPPIINAPDQLYTDVAAIYGGSSFITVYGQNSSGQYVGAESDYKSAFIWDATNGASAIPGMSHARDINESGQVAGYSTFPFPYGIAQIWDNVNGTQDIGSLGYKFNFAYGLNDFGTVVGNAGVPAGGPNHAFIWNSQDGMNDLNDYLPANSGWLLTEALTINNSGQIIGSGTLNGQSSSFIMSPIVVPEPISSILFLAGGTLLAGSRYLRRKNTA